jgi:hypothetical protein
MILQGEASVCKLQTLLDLALIEWQNETGRACDELRAVLGYMSPYFPFHAGSIKRELKVWPILVDLDPMLIRFTGRAICSRP